MGTTQQKNGEEKDEDEGEEEEEGDVIFTRREKCDQHSLCHCNDIERLDYFLVIAEPPPPLAQQH